MKKSNSEFKTAFVSEAGGELANNDYFAYIELDDYACYCLATGITDFKETPAAQIAVESFLMRFQDNPTMSRGSLVRYLEEVNNELLRGAKNPERLKASVLVIVSDYEKIRYMEAGNIRLRMYRQGKKIVNSRDMSLAGDLVANNETDTVLDKHEERHNLYAYLGKDGSFSPYVSDKVKLADGDILAFYTSGIWENVDEGEIDDIFNEAGNEPQESVDAIEDLLLSRQPDKLTSYTAAALFINKYYRDPEWEKRRARYIKIAIIVFIILLLLIIIGYIIYHFHQNKVEDLKRAEDETIEYIRAGNFVRAKESAETAQQLAQDLRYFDDEKILRNYLMVIDGIAAGDEAFKLKDYTSAFILYNTALDNTKNADNLGENYLRQKISQTEEYLFVTDFINLGYKAMDAGDLTKAESVFYMAREKAGALHDEGGRHAAMDALDSLYDKKAKMKADGEAKIKEAGAKGVADAMKKGDALMEQGDIEGAEKAYLEARAIANASGDRAARAEAGNSLQDVHKAKTEKKMEEQKSLDDKNAIYALATDALKNGDKAFTSGDYISAQIYYQTATEKFTALGEKKEVEQISVKLSLVGEKLNESQATANNAKKAEEDARNRYAGKDYQGAREAAMRAKELYILMSNKVKADEMTTLIETIDMDSVIDKNMY
ncbi:MAG: protein phosphatase [Selenomonadaceae bacterium]|nr:protein phosphatase [Selenomonadaceae bacterium]MBR3721208.1 protein phosphatase [Selenomonadaceae bacterium]